MAAKNYNSFPEACEVLLGEDGELHLLRQRQTPRPDRSQRVSTRFPRHLSRRVASGPRASAQTRRPSRLYRVTVAKMAKPGTTTSPHAAALLRAPASRAPQVITSAGIPTPKKLSPDSEENGTCYPEGRRDQDWADGVGQDVAEHDPPV